ncbi:MAG: MMPL family transporter [Kineosporiaceae bacterium]|nr:MMPL family transporter [Kineosporiaceae bacterium]
MTPAGPSRHATPSPADGTPPPDDGPNRRWWVEPDAGTSPADVPGAVAEILTAARAEAAEVVDRAERRAASIVEEARRQASAELREARSQARALIRDAAVIVQSLTRDGQGPSRGRPSPGDPATEAPAVADRAVPAAGGPASLAVPASPQARSPHRRAEPRQRSWGRFVHRHRWATIAVAGLLATIGALWGPGVVGLLANGGFDVPGSESFATDRSISTTVGRPTPDVIALYSSPELTVDDARFQRAVSQVVEQLPRAGVRTVTSYWTTNSPAMVSADRRSTIVGIYLSGDEDARIATYRAIADTLDVDPAVASTRLGGVSAADAQISDQVSADLTRAEVLSAPLLAVLLVIVFGGLVAAGLPLMVGGVTVVLAFAVLRLLLQVTSISVFAVNVVTLLGLGLAIDYALLMVKRFSEELSAGRDVPEALERTMRTAGRSILVSAVIVTVSLSGLLFFPMVFLRSMAYGGVAVVALAALVATTLLPATLAALGHRVDALALPWARRRAAARAAREDATGLWARLAHSVMRRPVIYVLAVGALLTLMALPVRTVTFGGIDERQLPTSAPARQVAEALADDFPQVPSEPIQILLTGGGEAAVSAVSSAVRAMPGVTGLAPAGRSGQSTLLSVTYRGEAVDQTARGLVESIRELTPPAGTRLTVGGYSAQQVDLRASIRDGLWRMALLVIAVTFLLLFLAFGSLVVPLKAVLITLATIVASLGVVVLVFQHGIGSGLLDFVSTGSIELTQPILVAAILFGLTTDYEIFLLSRIREYWDRTGDNTQAVALGLQRTGPIITSAAALILVVIAAFSTSKIIFIKLIGVGMAVSILLDATVMRALLVPATMRLLGRWNWWAPAPLARWWARHRPPLEGPRAEDAPEADPISNVLDLRPRQ